MLGRTTACGISSLLPESLDRSRTDSEALGEEAWPLPQIQSVDYLAFLFRTKGWRSPHAPPKPLRSPHSGAGALADKRVLEFSHRAHHVKDEPAA